MKKKEYPKSKKDVVLLDIHKGLVTGEINKTIDYVNALNEASKNVDKEYPILLKLAEDTGHLAFLKELESQGKRIATKEETTAFFLNKYDEMTNIFDQEQIKINEKRKKENKFWNKFKVKVREKYSIFILNMKEIWSFVKHEFLTIRNLIFFIHSLFFGKKYKNRKLLYDSKKRYINKFGYKKGDEKFNMLVNNITRGVEMNKRLIEMDKA